MTIETKYNIGDEVWGVPNGVPIKIPIKRVFIKVYKNDIRISYEFDNIEINDPDRIYRLPEYMVFPTKEELLKSL